MDCRKCGRPLTNAQSVKLGIGPVCRVNEKEESRKDDFCQMRMFGFHSLYDFGISGKILWLVDQNGPRSLTTN